MFCKIFNISIPYFCSLNIHDHKIWKRWTFTTLYFHLYLFDAKETQYRFSKKILKWYQTLKFDLHCTKSESQYCLIHITNKNEYSIKRDLPVANNRIWRCFVSVSTAFLLTTAAEKIWKTIDLLFGYSYISY